MRTLVILFLVFTSGYLMHCEHAVKTLPNKIDYHRVPEIFFKRIPDSLKYLVPIFDSILVDDQKYRQVNNPQLLRLHKKQQAQLDAENLYKVEKILQKYEWLNFRQAGFKGNLALKLVLEHAPLNIQIKYLPILQKQFMLNNVEGDFLSLFEDRINVRSHRSQKYGTQILYFHDKPVVAPLENADSVDIWRKSRGLIPINNYMKVFKSSFDPLAYKNQLQELKDHFKIN